MPRKLIAALIAVLAVAFAFSALAAMRWPSIMLAVAILFHEAQLEGVDWRALGLHYGIPYFAAAAFYYVASIQVARARPGAVLSYFLGCATGLPALFITDFELGWWRDPSSAEGAVAGACVSASLLAMAVWILRRRPALQSGPDACDEPEEADVAPAPKRSKRARDLPLNVAAYAPPRGTPFAGAIAANRARFARDGRRMMARRAR